MTGARHLVLYDGVCGLCNRSVQFILARDPAGAFAFASLQSGLGEQVLRKHGRDPRALDTVTVLADYGTVHERCLTKSRAVLFVLATLGGVWGMARLFWWVPAPVLDALYDLVARVRYRVFGKYDACPVPPQEHRARFVDLGERPAATDP